MIPSVLDVFVLSLLDRGLETPYDLHRQGGLSLGASTPALQRLVKAGLIERAEGEPARNRPRHEYRLTPSGKQSARSVWKQFLDDAPPSDLDSLLRVVDMAAHYRADKRKIFSFLSRAIARKSQLAQHAGLSFSATQKGDRASYTAMRLHCDSTRLLAEADTLAKISGQFRTKGVVAGQQSLM
jgi:DNA-binding PadR family transcriptional regulator